MPQRVDYLAITIGHAGRLGKRDLRHAVESVLRLIERASPLTAIDIAIDGYDADPREIWQIPEARRFIIDFAIGLNKAGVPADRLLPVAQQLIQLCITAEEGRESDIIISDEPVIDISDQLREHQARARRRMH